MATNLLTEDDFIFMSFEEVEDPPEGLVYHYKNYYWVVHPTKGLVFFNSTKRYKRYKSGNKYGSPQCNISEGVSKRLAESVIPFDYEIMKLRSVFLPTVRGYDY